MDAGARAPHSADGVFEGGGVKGLALVGGLLEFADHGYTDWVNVAGTSAGAIVAAYLATGHSAEQAKALLEATDFATFEDFGRGGLLVGGIVDLLAHHGLAHGQVFHEWFNRAVGGQTFADIEKGGRTLKLIASDITRHQMLVLPEDLAQFLDPRSGSPIDPGFDARRRRRAHEHVHSVLLHPDHPRPRHDQGGLHHRRRRRGVQLPGVDLRR